MNFSLLTVCLLRMNGNSFGDHLRQSLQSDLSDSKCHNIGVGDAQYYSRTRVHPPTLDPI